MRIIESSNIKLKSRTISSNLNNQMFMGNKEETEIFDTSLIDLQNESENLMDSQYSKCGAGTNYEIVIVFNSQQKAEQKRNAGISVIQFLKRQAGNIRFSIIYNGTINFEAISFEDSNMSEAELKEKLEKFDVSFNGVIRLVPYLIDEAIKKFKPNMNNVNIQRKFLTEKFYLPGYEKDINAVKMKYAEFRNDVPTLQTFLIYPCYCPRIAMGRYEKPPVLASTGCNGVMGCNQLIYTGGNFSYAFQGSINKMCEQIRPNPNWIPTKGRFENEPNVTIERTISKPKEDIGAPPPEEIGAPPPEEIGAPPPEEIGAPPPEEIGAPPPPANESRKSVITQDCSGNTPYEIIVVLCHADKKRKRVARYIINYLKAQKGDVRFSIFFKQDNNEVFGFEESKSLSKKTLSQKVLDFSADGMLGYDINVLITKAQGFFQPNRYKNVIRKFILEECVFGKKEVDQLNKAFTKFRNSIPVNTMIIYTSKRSDSQKIQHKKGILAITGCNTISSCENIIWADDKHFLKEIREEHKKLCAA